MIPPPIQPVKHMKNVDRLARTGNEARAFGGFRPVDPRLLRLNEPEPGLFGRIERRGFGGILLFRRMAGILGHGFTLSPSSVIVLVKF